MENFTEKKYNFSFINLRKNLENLKRNFISCRKKIWKFLKRKFEISDFLRVKILTFESQSKDFSRNFSVLSFDFADF